MCSTRIEFSTAAVILGMVSLAGCMRGESPKLHFVIPPGFRGFIKITPGWPDASAPQALGGRLVYHIPADGTLKVRSDAPFAAWHRQTAEYANGTPLLIGEEAGQGSNKETIALWSLFSSQDGSNWYYVGPKAEAMEAAYGGSLDARPGERVSPQK